MICLSQIIFLSRPNDHIHPLLHLIHYLVRHEGHFPHHFLLWQKVTVFGVRHGERNTRRRCHLHCIQDSLISANHILLLLTCVGYVSRWYFMVSYSENLVGHRDIIHHDRHDPDTPMPPAEKSSTNIMEALPIRWAHTILPKIFHRCYVAIFTQGRALLIRIHPSWWPFPRPIIPQ